jgi:hypothetical protein
MRIGDLATYAHAVQGLLSPSGIPMVIYHSAVNDTIVLFICGDAMCSTNSTSTARLNIAGTFSSAAVAASGMIGVTTVDDQSGAVRMVVFSLDLLTVIQVPIAPMSSSNRAMVTVGANGLFSVLVREDVEAYWIHCLDSVCSVRTWSPSPCSSDGLWEAALPSVRSTGVGLFCTSASSPDRSLFFTN